MSFIWLSCNVEKSGQEDEPPLTLIHADTYFDASGGYGIIQVSAGGREVFAMCYSAWIDPSLSDSTITFLVSPNETLNQRKATFIIESGANSLEVQVVQWGTYISIEPLELTFGPEGGVSYIDVRSGMPFQAESEAGWLDHEIITDRIKLTAGQTNLDITRMAPLKVNFTNGPSYTIIIIQEGNKLSGENISGDWIMSSTDINYEPNPDIRVTLYKKDDNNFILKGLEYELELEYRWEKLYINAGRTGGITDSGISVVCCSCRENRIYNYSHSSLRGDCLIDGDKLTFIFVDSGAWETFVADGFVFWEFSGPEFSVDTDLGPVSGTKRYYDIVLKKVQ